MASNDPLFVDDNDSDDDDDSSLGFKIHFEAEANTFLFIAALSLSHDRSLINQQNTCGESHDIEIGIPGRHLWVLVTRKSQGC
jgi:predicted secreted protein